MKTLLDATLKVQPHNLEAEMAVLGSMIIDKDALIAGIDALSDKHFFEERNQKIFVSIRDISEGGGIVDILTLSDKLKSREILASIGGGEYLTTLITVVPTAMHVADYISIVKEKYVLRKILRMGLETMDKAYRQEETADEVLEFAEAQLYSIVAESEQYDLTPVADEMHDHLDQMEAIKNNKNKTVGIQTGFQALDKLTSGLQRGNMIILAARPGMGKTSLAMDMIRHAIIGGGSVAFFSLEMTRTEIINRMISSVSGIPLFQVRNGYFPDSDWGRIQQASEKIYNSGFYLSHSNAHSTVNSVRACSRRLASRLLRQKKRLDLIVVDYLQLLRSSSKRFENEQTELSDISRLLKGMAVELNVPVLALAQLNRNPEEAGRSGKPRLADLRGSGALEQDSDIVMFIYREAVYNAKASDEEKAKAELLIEKHRNGATGKVNLFFRKEVTSFIEMETEAE